MDLIEILFLFIVVLIGGTLIWAIFNLKKILE